MKKFITLRIHNSQASLIELLETLKSSPKSIYTYQKKLTVDYAKNIFVDLTQVACFKTKRKSLFESCVWLLANDGVLVVTNITSTDKPQLGIVNYNLVLNTFFHDFIAPYLDANYKVEISGEEQSLQNILDTETFHKLDLWERTCNKEMPISHFVDYQRWMDFVISAYENESDLSTEDFSQWLTEDKHWNQMLDGKISELANLYKYGIDILKAFNNENR